MNKVSLLVFGAVGAAIVGWLAVQEHDDTPRPLRTAGSASASAAASSAPPEIALDLDAGFAEANLAGNIEGESDAGGTMPDGSEVPSLDDAPKSLRFGVVLVQYLGAQGAKKAQRNKAEAKKLATGLAAAAQDDFKAAVKKGDPGSTVDAGRMFRGILEPAPEYVLFSLEKGQVSEPVDTARGFWIVKRIE
jgi:parvulin-like peptidyl-prolyl isomerase